MMLKLQAIGKPTAAQQYRKQPNNCSAAKELLFKIRHVGRQDPSIREEAVFLWNGVVGTRKKESN